MDLDSIKEVYIFRHRYLYSEILDAESVFDSLDKAKDFMQINIELNDYHDDSYESSGDWYFEIVKYILNDTKHLGCTWYFDIKGNLLSFDDCSNALKHDLSYNEKESSPIIFTGKFKEGDIVFIPFEIWDFDDINARGEIGVVWKAPIPYDEWKKKKEEGSIDKEYWDSEYIIFIPNKENGMLVHYHRYEKQMKLYKKELPTKLAILNFLSECFKGKLELNDDIWNDIWGSGASIMQNRILKESDFKKAK